jgi:hypothetical protein
MFGTFLSIIVHDATEAIQGLDLVLYGGKLVTLPGFLVVFYINKHFK